MASTLDSEVKHITLEMKLDGVNWIDVTADIRAKSGIVIEYGIDGHQPTNRTAGPGSCIFTMDNSEGNSGGLLGYYSPDHTNGRSGFELNVPVRVIVGHGFYYGEKKYGAFYYGNDAIKFLGTLKDIDVLSGEKGPRITECVAKDFMWEMSKHKMSLLAVQEVRRSDLLIGDIVGNMGVSPAATSYSAGQETFNYGGDSLKDEKSTALAAAQKAVISELGYLYQKGDGTLVYEDRHYRIGSISQFVFGTEDLTNLKGSRSIKNLSNQIRTTSYPRVEGGSTETLYTLRNELQINAGQTKTVIGRYIDPNQLIARLSGKSFEDGEGLNEITGAGDERHFEDGTTGWAAVGNDSDAIEQSTEQAKQGSNSLKLTSGAGASNTNFVQTALYSGYAENDIVYFSAWVYLSAAWPGASGVDLMIAEYDSSSVIGTVTVAASTTTNGSWVRLTGTHTCVDVDCAKLRIMIGERTAEDFSGGAVSVYIDEVMLIDDNALNLKFGSTKGSGANDSWTDLELVATFGANAVAFQMTNNGGSTGYVNSLKARGTALRIFEPVETDAEDATSIAAYGPSRLELRLPYQDDPLVAADFANSLLADLKGPRVLVKDVTTRHSFGFRIRAAIAIEPGTRITASETMLGIDAEDYFVHKVKLVLKPPTTVTGIFGVVIASAAQSWLLGTVNYGELGTNTILGT